MALVAIAALSGCSAATPAATSGPSTAPSAPTAPTASDVPTPADPTIPALLSDAPAEQNLPYFASIVDEVWASGVGTQGRAYIDALIAAGFDRAAMQVTHDTSTVGNEAESIQFSVAWGAECLVGQVGSATGEPFSVVVPQLGSGGCLVGATRPIDW